MRRKAATKFRAKKKARAEPTAAKSIEELPAEVLEQILLVSVQKDEGQVSATVKTGKYPMFDLHVYMIMLTKYTLACRPVKLLKSSCDRPDLEFPSCVESFRRDVISRVWPRAGSNRI